MRCLDESKLVSVHWRKKKNIVLRIERCYHQIVFLPPLFNIKISQLFMTLLMMFLNHFQLYLKAYPHRRKKHDMVVIFQKLFKLLFYSGYYFFIFAFSCYFKNLYCFCSFVIWFSSKIWLHYISLHFFLNLCSPPARGPQLPPPYCWKSFMNKKKFSK